MKTKEDTILDRAAEQERSDDFDLRVDLPRPLRFSQSIQILLVLCVLLFAALLVQRAVQHEAAKRYETSVSVIAESVRNAESAAAVSMQEDEKCVNINTADLYELCRLEGIGLVKAQAILDYRAENGPFTYAEEITKVDGIGQHLYEGFAHMITLE